jgi:hypothetical protein
MDVLNEALEPASAKPSETEAESRHEAPLPQIDGHAAEETGDRLIAKKK